MTDETQGRFARIMGNTPLALAAAACAAGTAISLAGCMRMETQKTTLEHRPQIVQPESNTVASAPTEGVEQGPR